MFNIFTSQLFPVGFMDSHLGSLFNILSRQVTSHLDRCSIRTKICFLHVLDSIIFRMFVMIIKGLLILYPLSLDKGKYSLKCRQRGSMFAFIEYSSQYYISLLTIRPWIEFLLNQNERSFYFSTFLFFLYLLFKVNWSIYSIFHLSFDKGF